MRYLLCFSMVFIVILSSAQEYEKGVMLFKLKLDQAKPTKLKSVETLTDNNKLNQIFKKHSVFSYEQAYPFAKNPELLKIYKVELNGKDDDFRKDIENNARDLITDIERIPIPKATYEPTDYMWYLPTQQDPNGWLWHLKHIQAAQAWDITKSNSNIKIADVDTDFDILHPDLSAKISPNYDPMSLVVHSARGSSHGTATSSFAAAQTDGGGQLAAIGFNSNMLAYTWNNGVAKALHASNVMNADVITISWYHSCGTATTTETQMIKEILDNGTIIVVSAGNGSGDCNGGPIGPFTPLVDPRIICVTSTGIDDKHQYLENGIDRTHSGYPSVSISAPGYCVMSAVATTNTDGTQNTWPYYGCSTGTSFATPIVAGVCALMKSIDPCLTPARAKSLIQANADPIVDASSYPGMLGAGKINAFKCVKAAGTKTYSGSFTGTNTYTAGYEANLNNVTVQSSSNLTVQARSVISLTGTFSAPLGSILSFSVDPSIVNSCNW